MSWGTTDARAEPGPLTAALAALAEELQRVTVRVHGRGPARGSGVIWRADGRVVTNAHVARRHATVFLFDGRELGAEVVAWDREQDLALLQVEAAGLPGARVGDSDALRVGELVLALGHPRGLGGALTAGVIHAVGRRAPAAGPPWIRADLRLAPGNSGGSLADARGRVIGINAMIADGLALAVPSNTVERFVRSPGARPELGLIAQPLILRLAGEPVLGLLVLEVHAGSPSADAGLRTGDVLLAADGAPFRRPEDLIRVVRAAGPGEPLSLELLRGGARVVREVVLEPGRSPVATP